MSLQFELAVRDRYSAAAKQRVETLCCPVEYDPKLLRIIPTEVLERDYGCGDPSRHVRVGETVLDLGSGGGKVCFIASQVVGPKGRVIGVDMNDEMLALARRHQPAVAAAIGWSNIEFHKGRIQDLALDLRELDERLQARPLDGLNAFLEAEALAADLRRTRPLVAGASVDTVISNCVLNLVDPQFKPRVFAEIFRVLKPGGRAVISDIVSDREVPSALREDPELWSGCISGAMTEEDFPRAFVEAGFWGIRLLALGAEPWRTVEGMEFRSMTIEAVKPMPAGDPAGHEGVVIYRGPFREVVDDQERRFLRGRRHDVGEATYRMLQAGSAREHFWFGGPQVFGAERSDHGPGAKSVPSDAGAPPPSSCCGPANCC
jgi:SAM-dependent methyltransferase